MAMRRSERGQAASVPEIPLGERRLQRNARGTVECQQNSTPRRAGRAVDDCGSAQPQQSQEHVQDNPRVDARQPRGQKRQADELDDMVDVRLLETEAGKSNVIDFERILSASGIISNKDLPTRVNNDHFLGSDTTSNNANVHSRPLTNVSPANVCSAPSVRLADDDLAAHIPTVLKQQICRGEYVNFALLLKGAIELSEFFRGGIVTVNSELQLVSAPKECKDQIYDIEKWTNAFIIYASIYLSNHSDKVYELLHYMYNIRECAMRQGGSAWKTYDEQFRLRQAITPSPWSKINNDLWWRCMQVRQPDQAQNVSKFKYTCLDFNNGRCTWQNCKFPHLCAKCNAPHPEINCFSSNSVGYTQKSRTPAFQRNFRGRGSQSHSKGRGYNRGQSNK
jgi:hypothetical protein